MLVSNIIKLFFVNVLSCNRQYDLLFFPAKNRSF
jgi:hypothetical protein